MGVFARLIAALTSTALIATGCAWSSSDAESATAATPTARSTVSAQDEFSEAIAEARHDASEADASDEQHAMIDEIEAQGSVTFEQARIAALRVIDCLTEAGQQAQYTETTGADGFPIPGYTAEIDPATEAQSLAEIDACDYREAFWVNYLYQSQPQFQAAQAVADERRLAARIACLEDKGVAVPNEPLWHDVSALIFSLPEEEQIECAVAGA